MVKKIDPEMLIGFIEEAHSYLPKALDCIEKFKKDPKQLKELREAHRIFHTIKGAAAMVGLAALSHIAYFAEETLEDVESGELVFNQNVVELLISVVSQIEHYLEGLLSGALDEQAILIEIIKTFRRLKGLPEAEDEKEIIRLIEQSQLDTTDNIDLSAKNIFEDDSREIDQRDIFESDNFENYQDKDDSEKSYHEEDDDDQIEAFSSTMSSFEELLSPELMEAFLEEGEEHLQTITKYLRLFQQNPQDKDALQEIRRSVHTLKGAAGMVNYKSLSRLSHRMEDLLDDLYENEKEASGEMFKLLAITSDALEDLLRNQDTIDSSQFETIYNAYSAFLATQAPSPTSVSPEAGGVLAPLGNLGNISISSLSTSSPAPTPVEIPLEIPAPAEAGGDTQTGQQSSQYVRIPLERLDELVKLISELVVSRSTFEQYFRGLISENDELRLSMSRLQRIVAKLETEYEASMLGQGLTALAGVGAKALMSSSLPFTKAPVALPPTEAPVLNAPRTNYGFDDLEFDRYTEFHLITRELSETTGDINAVGNEFSDIVRNFDSYLTGLGRLTSEIQDKLMRLRMVPLSTLSARLHRTVRVTAGKKSKEAYLTIEGENVELDKTMLEELADPLLHILRNAVDHGIEPAARREVAGKPPSGRIHIRAYYEATQTVVQISDDGRGLDPELIRAAAIRNGYLSEADAAQLTNNELYELIFLAGFSTASEVSEISGRGVGMDIVKATVNRMRGTISVYSSPGKGTTFTIRLPLTLAIMRVILVKDYHETWAIPLAAVKKILRPEPSDIEQLGQKQVVRVEGKTYPLFRLGESLNLKQPADTTLERLPMLLLNIGDQKVAFAVEQLLEAREVVVKSMGNMLRHVPGIGGATLMGDGSVVLILNPNELIKQNFSREVVSQRLNQNANEPKRKTLNILIVDDSVSVRRILANMVKRNGWTPYEAKDGVEALEQLQSFTKNPDIILLDIEMPRMDGYELTATLRANQAYKDIPIVMITSRAGDKHRQKALSLGATEYLVKPYQEETLLNIVHKWTK